ncbi:GNAT family N-acetyltransferase [Rhizobiaceae bacterium CRRU44]|uniref:GNAT family N-acetyltransferase n=1 Tax=Ferranicluibacter rubi TaxID=2715133 RepID=A0AA43ZEX1_9HYPH|nr:GNAT family N-acetyltransferase [Ferranicluibacter rubi]NHT76603.1 GNAT family N-acetyltransferase [Ferranicluibacter rubi]
MIITQTERLRIRNWLDTDRDLFFEINSDPEVMTFFPFRRDRADADALFDRNRQAIADTGYGFFALALKETNEPIGFCGLAIPDLAPILPIGTVEIGWRLARRHWSKGYVTEAASALLAFGFETRCLDEIVSFAVAGNRRSIAVMERIGLIRAIDRDFDHPRVPDTYPHLKRHVLYRRKRPE